MAGAINKVSGVVGVVDKVDQANSVAEIAGNVASAINEGNTLQGRKDVAKAVIGALDQHPAYGGLLPGQDGVAKSLEKPLTDLMDKAEERRKYYEKIQDVLRPGGGSGSGTGSGGAGGGGTGTGGGNAGSSGG